jgi:hypothetical protein
VFAQRAGVQPPATREGIVFNLPGAILVSQKNTNEPGKHIMDLTARRVALVLDLQWPYKRHTDVYEGIQRFAEERGWVTVLDEFAHDTLRRRPSAADRYAGIVARAKRVPQHPYQDVTVWRKTERLIARAMDGYVPPVGVHVAQEDTGRLVVLRLASRRAAAPRRVA